MEGRLFFVGEDASGDVELWVSDGTPGGTRRVRDINTTGSSAPGFLTKLGSSVLFSANGSQLWRSDGSEAGTRLVKNINASGNAYPIGLTNLNGTLLFSADDGMHGRELWVSDGTPDGTVMVKDINPGRSSSVPDSIRQVRDDGWALFAASGGPDGVELWQTDGTQERTQQVQDIALGAPSSNPVSFVGAGSKVYFIADDGHTGPELWSLDRGLFPDRLPNKTYLPLARR